MESAMEATLLAGLTVAGFGAYALTHSLTHSTMAGAVSEAAYLYAPIRMRELFIQGNAGQFMAWAFLPAACWGVLRLYQTGNKRYIWVIALSFLGTSLSHNVVALLLALLLAGFTLTVWYVASSFPVGVAGSS